MSTRPTRHSVRTSAGLAAAQPLNRNFVSGGRVAPSPNIPIVTEAKPAAQPAEMTMDGDFDMAETPGDQEAANGEKRRPPWMTAKKAGVKKKPNKQLIQHRLRKQLTPKNATVALQEVCPGLSYTYSQTPSGVFTAEVEVQDKKYHGVGSTKALARAAAAELALQSFIKTPERITDENGRQLVRDETPWAALAGFALHKMFCDWRRGNVGTPLSVDAAAEAPAPAASPAAAQAAKPAFTLPPLQPQPADGSAAGTPASAAEPKERKPKTLPEDWATRHPAQLLHEMQPGIKFEAAVEHLPAQEPHKTLRVSYNTTTEVNGQTFTASGPTKKKSKREVARVVMNAVYGCTYPKEE